VVVIPADVVSQKLGRTDPFIRALVGILIENLRNVHNAYIVRPRSVHDFSRLLQDNAEQLRHFVINNAEQVDDFARLAGQIDALDVVISQLARQANAMNDRRDDNVPTDSVAL